MVDFDVAYEKLCQFESSDELADFLTQEGVKGKQDLADACALAVWMQTQTGENILVSTVEMYKMDENDDYSCRRRHNDTLASFVQNFDFGKYPELVSQRPEWDDYSY